MYIANTRKKKFGNVNFAKLISEYKNFMESAGYKFIGEGGASVVYLDTNANVVVKKIIIDLGYGLYDREVFWLKYLNNKNFSWCPKFIDVDPQQKMIAMSYAGEPINRDNAPPDWETQLQEIINELHRHGIRHNDIKNTEVMVLNGKIKIVDFAWCSFGWDWSCGRKFRNIKKPTSIFKDENAVARIKKYLSDN